MNIYIYCETSETDTLTFLIRPFYVIGRPLNVLR